VNKKFFKDTGAGIGIGACIIVLFMISYAPVSTYFLEKNRKTEDGKTVVLVDTVYTPEWDTSYCTLVINRTKTLTIIDTVFEAIPDSFYWVLDDCDTTIMQYDGKTRMLVNQRYDGKTKLKRKE